MSPVSVMLAVFPGTSAALFMPRLRSNSIIIASGILFLSLHRGALVFSLGIAAFTWAAIHASKKQRLSLKLFASLAITFGAVSYLQWRGYLSPRALTDFFGDLLFVPLFSVGAIRSIWEKKFSMSYLFFPGNFLWWPWASVAEFSKAASVQRKLNFETIFFYSAAGIAKIFVVGRALDATASNIFYNPGGYSLECLFFSIFLGGLETYFVFGGAIDCFRATALAFGLEDPCRNFRVMGFGYWPKLSGKTIALFLASGVGLHLYSMQEFFSALNSAKLHYSLSLAELFPKDTLSAQNLWKGIILAAVLAFIRPVKSVGLANSIFLLIVAIILSTFPYPVIHSLNYFSFF